MSVESEFYLGNLPGVWEHNRPRKRREKGDKRRPVIRRKSKKQEREGDNQGHKHGRPKGR